MKRAGVGKRSVTALAAHALAAPAVLFAAGLAAAGLAAPALADAVAPETQSVTAPSSTAGLSTQAYAKLPVCTLSADGRRLAVEPCRTAPARQPMPRRPVMQIIQRMPTASRAPQVAMPPQSPSLPLQTLLAPRTAPTPTGGCDVIGCYNSSGIRYNNPRAAVPATPSSRLCFRDNAWMPCP